MSSAPASRFPSGSPRRWHKIALWLLTLLALAYAALVVVMYNYQRQLIYPAIAAQPAKPEFEPITYTTADGLTLHAGYRAPQPGMPTLVFFHGNAMVWPQDTCCTKAALAAGYGLLMAEYRGYNGNPGQPTEQGLYNDGRAALQWLAKRGTGPQDTILVGYSLGSGVATQMALENHPRALILLSAYASMAQAAAHQYPFLPVNSLLKDRFDNIAKFARLDMPVLLVHGTDDAIVPLAQARALAQAQPKAVLEVVQGASHTGAADDLAMQQRQLAFIEALARR